jgi:hypothetical protein
LDIFFTRTSDISPVESELYNLAGARVMLDPSDDNYDVFMKDPGIGDNTVIFLIPPSSERLVTEDSACTCGSIREIDLPMQKERACAHGESARDSGPFSQLNIPGKLKYHTKLRKNEVPTLDSGQTADECLPCATQGGPTNNRFATLHLAGRAIIPGMWFSVWYTRRWNLGATSPAKSRPNSAATGQHPVLAPLVTATNGTRWLRFDNVPMQGDCDYATNCGHMDTAEPNANVQFDTPRPRSWAV